jgi:hypothetical protein
MWSIVMTRDGRSHVGSHARWLDELCVVEGLK